MRLFLLLILGIGPGQFIWAHQGFVQLYDCEIDLLAPRPWATPQIIVPEDLANTYLIADEREFERILAKHHAWAVPASRDENELLLPSVEKMMIVRFKAVDNNLLVTQLQPADENAQRDYWRRIANHHHIASVFSDLGPDMKESILISGPVLVKLIVKHDFTFDEIAAILIETQKGEVFRRKDVFRSITHYGGVFYEVLIAYEDNRPARLVTIYPVGQIKVN